MRGTTKLWKFDDFFIRDRIGQTWYEQAFGSCVIALAEYFGYDTRSDHIKKLFKTISDTSFYVAFEADKYHHIAITFHSSKGLEFEQVIVFAEDYRLSDMPRIYNHYVVVTRAKSKLIIVKLNNYNANCFQHNLQKIFSESGHSVQDIVSFETEWIFEKIWIVRVFVE